MSSKARSNASTETPNKVSPATPRVNKTSRGVTKSEPESPSPLQNTRLSVDRSPRSVNSKPVAERRSPKLNMPPDKQPTKVAKGSELQAQLNLAQEDLKKAKEQLTLVEKEKAQAINDLNEAQKAAEETNEKLREALVAQKRAEENTEIEKFRAVELEQAGIEAAQKKEEEWQREIEAVRNQHALDVAALLSTTQELQRVKQELAMTCDAKNQALIHADDATKIAEIHAEKVEILSSEVTRLKSLLDSKLDIEASENSKIVVKLNSEIESLKQELEKAKNYEEELNEKDSSIEHINVELEAAKMAESYAHSLLDEWKRRVEELEIRVEQANTLERSASESLESVMRQLEGNNSLLDDAEAEISALKEKAGLLEMTIGRQKAELMVSECNLDMAKEEILGKSKKVEYLESELESVKEEKAQALNKEKLAASSIQTLLEEKNKLINELENSREEEEKSKKAMESLASALHEVSVEAREAKEKLLSSQNENESFEAQIEDLRLVLKVTNEKYESMLDDAKREIDQLVSTIEKYRDDFENSKEEWEKKELHLVGCMKESEEKNSSLEREIKRLVNLIKQTEEEACMKKEEEDQLRESLREVESEVIYLQETLGQAKAESLKLKEGLLDKENELQSVAQDNEELRSREAASLKKVEELAKLLDVATAKHQREENGDLTDSEKDYDLLPKVVEYSEVNGHGEDMSKIELLPDQSNSTKLCSIEKESLLEESTVLNDKCKVVTGPTKIENGNGDPREEESKGKDDPVEAEYKMWESCKIEKKEFSPGREPEHESFDEEVESKAEVSEGFDQINGVSSAEHRDDERSSPFREQQLKKKKKPLLSKFGSLLKKKGSVNQK